jgi:hypothetical protein
MATIAVKVVVVEVAGETVVTPAAMEIIPAAASAYAIAAAAPPNGVSARQRHDHVPAHCAPERVVPGCSDLGGHTAGASLGCRKRQWRRHEVESRCENAYQVVDVRHFRGSWRWFTGELPAVVASIGAVIEGTDALLLSGARTL